MMISLKVEMLPKKVGKTMSFCSVGLMSFKRHAEGSKESVSAQKNFAKIDMVKGVRSIYREVILYTR